MNSVTFNGTNLNTFGVLISGVETYGAPNRIVRFEDVKGRNGSVIIDEGSYANAEMTYHAMIHENFAENIESLRNFLLNVKGYARLEDTYHPDVFYKACYSDAVEPTVKGYGNTNGEFDIVFNRKPQRFLKSGETTIELTASGIITNPTAFESLPLIRVYGTGTIVINSTQVVITSPTSYTDLDCEVQDAYYGSQNLNSYITITPYAFPYFVGGANTISFDSGITRVLVTPRWWKL